MKKIYILQMHTKTFLSRIVKLFSNYKYSHIAISLDSNCNTLYSFGRKKYNTPLDGGFSIFHKKGKFFRIFKETYCRILEVEVTNEQYNKLKKKLNDIKSNKQKYTYDYLGIILRYLKIPITFKNKYVCSYFIASLLEECDIYHFPKKTYFVKPQDFEKIKTFNEIYIGKYLLYK